MKQIISFIAAVFLSTTAFAQVPNKISFQAIIRNSSNALVTNQSIGMQISILQGALNGSVVYVETHSIITNLNGLASLEIGGGTAVTGTFAGIDWAAGPYFVKTETDPMGGTSYSITGTQQLLSVPYALYAQNAGNSTPGPQGPAGPQGLTGATGPAGSPASDDQQLSVSLLGDTLFLQNGGFVIIPGISTANNGGSFTGITQHTCGADSIHNPNLAYGNMTDQDGNVYKTRIIGTQQWMAENLKTSHYRNGDPIPLELNNSQWLALTTGATAWYQNDSATYECPYGQLYNFYAVADPRNVCPVGWHVPSIAEFDLLLINLDSLADTSLCYFCDISATAGEQLKSPGLTYWNTPNAPTSNNSGFSALPTGSRNFNGTYHSIHAFNHIWTSTSTAINAGAFYSFQYNNTIVTRDSNYKQFGLTVRCVRD